MPGVRLAFQHDKGVIPKVERALIGRSTTIREGDLLVLTTVAARTSGPRVVRAFKAVAGDTAANLVTYGVAGVALCTIATDSSGNIITPPSAVTTRGPQVQPDLLYPWETYRDPDTGYLAIPIARWTSENYFLIPISDGSGNPSTDTSTAIGGRRGFYPPAASGDNAFKTYYLNKADSTNAVMTVRDLFPKQPTPGWDANSYALVQPMDAADAFNIATVFNT